MPSHNEQEYEQRRQQIISGALRAFSAKGFAGASNRDIAVAARIASPGLIYHYFKDKEDLLYQVLIERMPLIRLMNSANTILALPPDEALPQLTLSLAEMLSDETTIALLKIVLAEAIHNPFVAQTVNELGPGRGLRMLADYLERQMAAGQLRPMDPQIAARIFVGPLMAYVLTCFIFDQPESKAIPPAEMARATAEAFLRMLAPEREVRAIVEAEGGQGLRSGPDDSC